MTNIVDTSMETINTEFDAAEKDIGPDPETQENEKIPEPDPIAEAQREAEIAMATGMIATSLRFSISSFSGVKVDDDLTNQTAESYALLIIKYFPGGIFALLDRYKEEIAATTATFVLIRAISDAKTKKAEEEAEKKNAEEAKKPEEKNETTTPTGVAFNG